MRSIFTSLTLFYLALCQSAMAKDINKMLIPKHEPIKRIVLDAGHGGKDGGAHGSYYHEKDITLSITRLVGKILAEKNPEIEIIYTRDRDEFIPLFERIGLANKKNADLFLSIHCNWISNPNTKGTETYVMGLHRAAENLNVAKRENEAILMEADFQSNYEGYDPNSPLGHIMLSIFQDQYLSQSISLANNVEQNFKKRGYSTSRGVKQAGFAVLRRASMPSILIETGFLSNSVEEKYLGSDEGQYEIATAIVEAIQEFGKIPNQNDDVAKNFISATKSKVSKEIKSIESTVSQDIPAEAVSSISTMPSKPESTVNTNVSKYYIQIAALQKDISTKLTNDKELAKIGNLSVAYDGILYKYRVGEYLTQEDARKAKERLINLGYTTCFLTTK